MGAYYRRGRRNGAGVLLREAVAAGNRLPWWGAAIMGLVSFSTFYWIVPAWMQAQWDPSSANSPVQVMIKPLFERRVHWLQYLGITLGLIGLFFTVKNYYREAWLSRDEERGVGFFARLIGRFLD